jgi:uncharacterized protein (TIGR02646 family)
VIWVDRGKKQPPAVLTGEESSKASAQAKEHFGQDAAAARQRLFKFAPIYGRTEVRADLLDLFERKCAFCESKLDPAVANPITHHFRPKQEAVDAAGKVSRTHYWWLAYEWENLYLSCQRCATAAQAQFPMAGDRAAVGARGAALQSEKPLLVDPCRDDPDEHLVFKADGSVEAATPRGEHTIAVYALNRRPLVEARRKEIENARNRAVERGDDREQPYAAAIRQVLGPASAPDAAHEAFSWLRHFGRNVISKLEPLVDWFRRGAEPAPPVRAPIVECLELRDFRGIQALEVRLADLDEQAPWTMLLGENGHGKTSVLQALALILMGENGRAKLAEGPETLIRKNADSAEIVAHMRNEGERRLRITRAGFEAVGDDEPVLLAAYGAARIPSTSPSTGLLRRGKPDASQPRVRNLFDAGAPLIDANAWLQAIDNEAFNYAGRALRRLLVESGEARTEKELEETEVVREDGRVVLNMPGRPAMDIGNLSDGYRSMIALATDIMSFFVTRFDSPDAARGVVLVDEIGAHLHPRWQMRVVEGFREAFPLVQFVATTHDPLCLRGLRGKREVVVLRRTFEHEIYALPTEEVPPVTGLRVDELLTSEVFGLRSSLDPELERDYNRYYELLLVQEPGPAETAEIAALKSKLDEFRQLGTTWRERLALEEADRYLARERDVADGTERKELLAETKHNLRAIWTRPLELPEEE